MMFVLLSRSASRARTLGLVVLLVSYIFTGHGLGGSCTLWGALALLGLIYWANRAPRGVAGVRSGQRELAT
jgi:hypothetical protein